MQYNETGAISIDPQPMPKIVWEIKRKLPIYLIPKKLQ